MAVVRRHGRQPGCISHLRPARRRRQIMLRRRLIIASACCALGMAFSAQAAGIIVGLLSQFSGPYAWWGHEYKRGVDLYVEQISSKIGTHTVTVLARDEGGTSPQKSRQLAQELVVRDQVQYLLGGTFTPTVLGVT